MNTVQKGFPASGNKAVIEIGDKKYFSSAETARILGLCASSFYAFKHKHKLQGRRVGRRKYYSEETLDKIISKECESYE